MTPRIHNRFRSGPARHCARRRGAVLVAALVCMLVVITILGGMLQGTLRARRQLHTQRDLRQTELLVEAGADRAAFRLARDLDYRGETWKLSSEQIVGRGDGQVTLTASRASDDQPWQLRVIAEYPLGGEFSIQRSRTFVIQPQSLQP
ncbi:MAG: hypothetical protein WD669_02590 [Pirellulales bacterium]